MQELLERAPALLKRCLRSDWKGLRVIVAAGIRMGSRGFPIGAALVLPACAVGPDYEPVAVPTLPNLHAAQGFSCVAETDRRWWPEFRDATLNGLLADALAHNSDMRLGT